MFRKIWSWNFLQIILIILIAGGILIFVLNIRVQNAKAELDEYRQAEFCQDKPDCRQIVEGVITYSKTAKQIISIPAGRTSSRRVTSLNYFVHFKAGEQDEVEVKILPVISNDTKIVDPARTFTPIPPFEWLEHFAENSFPEDYPVKIETWRGKTTILFSTRINYSSIVNNNTFAIDDLFNADGDAIATLMASDEVTNNNEFVAPVNTNENTKQTQTYLSAPEIYLEIAVPTTDNPLMYYEAAQNDLNQAIFAIGFFILFFSIFKFISNMK